MLKNIWTVTNRKLFIVSLIISILLSLASMWSLHEDDIFWQIRAGSEIVKNLKVQQTDTWSYTVKGSSWVNYQWLSDVSFYLVYIAGGEAALIIYRVTLIFLWFFLICLILSKIPDTALINRLLAILFLVPLIYVSVQFRLHLRPEIFCVILFCLQILLWNTQKKLFWQIIIVLLASNFHGGVAIFNLMLGVLIIVFSLSLNIREKILYAFVCIAAMFVTPVHFLIINQLIIHSQYDIKIFFNKEWQSFSFDMLNVKHQGWIFVCWFFILLAGIFSFYFKKELWKEKVFWIFGTVITIMSFKYIRTIPYSVIFFAPLIVYGTEKIRERNKYLLCPIIVLIVFTWTVILTEQVFKYKARWGLTVNTELFPVSITKFIEDNKPQARVFADAQASSYMLWFLPQYETYIDHRDVIYNSIKGEFSAAMREPRFMNELLKKYNINTVVNTYTKGVVLPDGKVHNTLEMFYPKKEWALVYFTNQYVLMVKRIDKHKEIINEFEYKVIDPTIPAPMYAFSKKIGDYRLELYRCLKEEPKNFFCNTIVAAEKIKTHNKSEILDAIRILSEIEERQNINDYMLDIQHYSLKWRAYDLLGDVNKASEVEKIILELYRR